MVHDAAKDGARLATIGAAILVAPGAAPADVERLEARLTRLFEEVRVVDAGASVGEGAPAEDTPAGRFPLAHWEEALRGSSTERVVVVAAGREDPSDALLLALVAWPETDVVLPRDATGLHPLCAIYRSDLHAAASGAADLDAILASAEVSTLENADLVALEG